VLRADRPAGRRPAQGPEARGLLDETLVVWCGEFGRTPVSQSGDGRDHHKQGFSVWLAGGGIREARPTAPPTSWATTPSSDRVMVADLHATILHLLGLDHRKVTYHLHGRDERLTDVYDAPFVRIRIQCLLTLMISRNLGMRTILREDIG
jgi:arylsulfatase A-like enzyme